MFRRVVSVCLLVSILFYHALPVIAASDYIYYANEAHKMYEEKDYLNSAKYYEKAYSISSDNVFKNNFVVAYQNYIQSLVNKDDYSKAIDLSVKLVDKYPSVIKLKEQLSDIYYYRSTDYFYVGKFEKAKADLQNSLKYAVVQDQKSRAKENLEKINYAISSNFKPRKKAMELPKTIPGVLSVLEKEKFGNVSSNLSVNERLEKLEKECFNKKYKKDPAMGRIERLKAEIFPEDFGPESNSVSNGNNYIQSIIDQSRGRVNIFGVMPVMVYIDSTQTKVYKKDHKKIVQDAFKSWQDASNDLLSFQFTNDPYRAKIKVVFKDTHEEFPWNPVLKTNNIDEQQKKKKYKKASMFVRIGSIATMIAGSLIGIPFIGNVGALGNSVASPYLAYKGSEDQDGISEMVIGLADIVNKPKDEANLLIKRRALHQIGHAIGIQGHSPNPNDIMYIDFSVNDLSERDKSTVREIYKSLYTKK